MDRRVCGVDEVGRGPLAGGVYAAAVILDPARPVEGLVFAGAILAGAGFVAEFLLALSWIFVGGSMEQSVHLAFVITTACVAGVTMVLTGFVLKLLLDNLSQQNGF